MTLSPLTILLTLIDARSRFRRVDIMGYDEPGSKVVRARLAFEDGVAVMWLTTAVLLLAAPYWGGVYSLPPCAFSLVEM